MKTKLLSLLLFSLTTKAAVHSNHGGLGEVLLLPYYTVNNGLATLVSVSNTTNMSKALKIKFREGRSGLSTGAINAYLAPKDVWTFALTKNQSHVQLISNDLSCTPGFTSPMNISPYDQDQNPNFGKDDVSLYEGMIEVYEMGELSPKQGFGQDMTFVNGLPIDCQQLEDNWSKGGAWDETNGLQELQPAGGGLMASVSIINVSNGVNYGYDATALANFYPDNTLIHTGPLDTNTPSLADANKTSSVYYQGDTLKTMWPNGFEAVSAVLSAKRLTLDYSNNLSINGQTEVVLTLPTRSLHLSDIEYNPPFKQPEFSWGDDDLFEPITYDRDGTGTSYVPGNISPIPPILRFESNVIKIWDWYLFDNTLFYPILDSENMYPQSILKGSEGMYQITFNQSTSRGRNLDNTEIHRFYGLPVIGIYFMRYTNSNAQPGLLAQYGAAFKFKSEQHIEVEDL